MALFWLFILLIEKDQIVDRIDQICKVAYDKNVSIFIDAEDSWFQDFIDEVAYQMIAKYRIVQVSK